MTDEENQRQRHLAEMMIKQCDDKIVEYEANKGMWVMMASPISEHPNFPNMNLRLKPEPREWWLCLICNSRLLSKAVHRVFYNDNSRNCQGEVVLVREVLDA